MKNCGIFKVLYMGYIGYSKIIPTIQNLVIFWIWNVCFISADHSCQLYNCPHPSHYRRGYLFWVFVAGVDFLQIVINPICFLRISCILKILFPTTVMYSIIWFMEVCKIIKTGFSWCNFIKIF